MTSAATDATTAPVRVWLAGLRAEVTSKCREVHVVRVDAATGSLHSLCGEWMRPSNAEWATSLGQRPCVQCQLLSDEPDHEALARVPGWPSNTLSGP